MARKKRSDRVKVQIREGGSIRYKIGVFKVHTPVGVRYNAVTHTKARFGYKTAKGAIKAYLKMRKRK